MFDDFLNDIRLTSRVRRLCFATDYQREMRSRADRHITNINKDA
jgi:hypothetical protein